MKTIPLHGAKAAGRCAVIDDCDYELVAAYHWYIRETRPASRSADGPYAQAKVRRDGRQVTVVMHKLITGWPMTDHANGDGLDNRRSNLRQATPAQNSRNRRSNSGSSSQYKGVTWHRGVRKWQASITTAGKKLYLGCHVGEAEAARAYDAAAIVHFGEFARLNFPQEAVA